MLSFTVVTCFYYTCAFFWCVGGGGGGKGKPRPVDTVEKLAKELGFSADISIFYRTGYRLKRLFTVCLESAKYT